ncbi:DUF6234 family protein [Streptomyces sp. NPDC050856]|uniref:DUF6234 family protein n=1 Tax=Streptomyces sp. NPDC050856 TaxID=3154939 RepID=UPI0033E586DD
MSNLPIAPPAHDASVKPPAGRGADVGMSCLLVFVELAALAVILIIWPFLDHFDLARDPDEPVEPVSMWRYLPAVGGVGLLALVAAVIASRARAVVTVVSQGAMAVLVTLLVFGGGTLQDRLDEHDGRPLPAPTSGVPGCRSGGSNSECAKHGG